MKPVIAITVDFLDDKIYSQKPYYAIRDNYSSCLEQFGAIPVMLPYSYDNIDSYLDMIDGLVITGGNFDISPTLYGEKNIHHKVIIKDNRTKFEFEITKKAFAKKMPILGICGGEQLINVIFGGNLIQDIEDEVQNALNHEQKPHDKVAHEVEVNQNSILHEIVGSDKISVNSTHHQAVKQVAPNFVVSGKSSDGVIEAIEFEDKKQFCLGVQWHPEYLISNSDQQIIDFFVEKAIKYSSNK